jgi:hypothetical protein
LPGFTSLMVDDFEYIAMFAAVDERPPLTTRRH